jgi:putative ABC transport system substrate-binding protein
VNRRQLLALLGGAAAGPPGIAIGQQPSRPALVGLFTAQTGVPAEVNAFRQALRDLGYVEGRDVSIVYHAGPPGAVTAEMLPHLAVEMVGQKPDVIVTPGGVPFVKALMQATSTIPIVMVTASDAAEAGVVASLSHPGGNVTGLSWQGEELRTKRLALLCEALPHVRRVAVMVDPQQFLRSDATEAAAKSLGIEVRVLELSAREDFAPAFESAESWGTQAISSEAGRYTTPNRNQFVALEAKHRLPSMHHQSIIVQAGGLMSYGPNFPDLFRRAAGYAVKILKGAKPSELPVEQPVRFEFAINLKTARSLGLAIAPSILARADEVIE